MRDRHRVWTTANTASAGQRSAVQLNYIRSHVIKMFTCLLFAALNDLRVTQLRRLMLVGVL